MASVIPSASLGTDAAEDRIRLHVAGDTNPADRAPGPEAGTPRPEAAAERRFRFELAAHPGSAATARRLTRDRLTGWSIADDTCDTAALVVSELVTNALVHTQGPVRLDLILRGDRVRVCVSDSSPRAPAKPVIVDWESTGGRGLLLVEAMSDAFGSVPVAGGKQVWSEIVVPEAVP